MKKLMTVFFTTLIFLYFWEMHQTGAFMEEIAEGLIFSFILIFISAVDYEKGIIPDSAVILLVINRVIYISLFCFPPVKTAVTSAANGLINSLTVLVTAVFISHKLKRPSMGLGDVKLLFATGTYFSLAENQLVTIISCLSCIVAFFLSKKREKMPFGPFITLGCLLVLLVNSVWSV